MTPAMTNDQLEAMHKRANFQAWWNARGFSLDPDPGVPWHDKREEFARYAFEAGLTCDAATGAEERVAELTKERDDLARDAGAWCNDCHKAEGQIAALIAERDAAHAVLRDLACYVGSGGYSADTVDPEAFRAKVRDWIDGQVDQLARERDAAVARCGELGETIRLIRNQSDIEGVNALCDDVFATCSPPCSPR